MNERSSSQYIHNADYSWSIMQVAPYQCVYLTKPELRALSRDEARDLFIASRIPFPFPPGWLAESTSEAAPVNVVPRFRGDDILVDFGSGGTMPSGTTTTTQRAVLLRGPAPPTNDQ